MDPQMSRFSKSSRKRTSMHVVLPRGVLIILRNLFVQLFKSLAHSRAAGGVLGLELNSYVGLKSIFVTEKWKQ